MCDWPAGVVTLPPSLPPSLPAVVCCSRQTSQATCPAWRRPSSPAMATPSHPTSKLSRGRSPSSTCCRQASHPALLLVLLLRRAVHRCCW